jgi:hypothetical protein
MNDICKSNLWEELKLLQATVNKFDDFSYRVKNWFITIVIAITGYAIYKPVTNLLFLNFAIFLIFYPYEVSYRIAQGAFLKRLREVQGLLRGDVPLNDDNKSPNMDKYLFDTKSILDDKYFLKFQKWLKLDEDRAKRNLRELQLICDRSWRYLFQLRISLLYLLVLLGNVILLLILKYL